MSFCGNRGYTAQCILPLELYSQLSCLGAIGKFTHRKVSFWQEKFYRQSNVKKRVVDNTFVYNSCPAVSSILCVIIGAEDRKVFIRNRAP